MQPIAYAPRSPGKGLLQTAIDKTRQSLYIVPMKLSIIVPVYNEERTLPIILNRLLAEVGPV